MTVARVPRTGRPTGLGRITVLLCAVALPLAKGCGDDGDGGIVQDTLGGGAECGNGMVEAEESCDDENDDPRDDCTNACQAAVCGDGIAGAGEACDDADDDDADSCTAACGLGPAAVAAVGTGEAHVCALSEVGEVRCWGAPDSGRLGQPGYEEHIGDDEPPSDWDLVEMGGEVLDLVTGQYHNCALLAGGQVRCWGDGSYGQLGYGNYDDVGDDETPAEAGDVPVPGSVASLAAGSRHTCAVLEANGEVACWGDNDAGQLGLGHTDSIGDDDLDVIAIVPLPGPAAEVAAGELHTCVRMDGGDVICWGDQTSGQLGTGTPDTIGDDEPIVTTPIDLGGKAIDIDTYYNHTCAVLEDGGVRCWGANGSGQLGNGDAEGKIVGDRKTPAEEGVVMLEEPALTVEAGRSHTCAVLRNGDVRCWGSNAASGIPTTEIYYNSPAPQGPAHVGAPVQRLSAAYDYSCAILDSAGVRCWGSNTGSVLGNPMVSSGMTVTDPATLEDVDVF